MAEGCFGGLRPRPGAMQHLPKIAGCQRCPLQGTPSLHPTTATSDEGIDPNGQRRYRSGIQPFSTSSPAACIFFITTSPTTSCSADLLNSTISPPLVSTWV